MIGSLEDVGIKFDFVNIKVHAWRPYSENFKSFEAGRGPRHNYSGALKFPPTEVTQKSFPRAQELI